ncbi:MAG: hypothetical protein ACOYM9_03560 [Bradymonadia bacterium]
MSAGLILTLNLAVTAVLVGLIWTIQGVHYPAFAEVGTNEFARFHAAHSARITLLVGPLMLAEVAASAWLVAVSAPGVDRHLAVFCAALVAVAWLSTALIQVPLHAALPGASGEARAALVARLVATNWLRTAAWTLRGAVLLWATLRRAM